MKIDGAPGSGYKNIIITRMYLATVYMYVYFIMCICVYVMCVHTLLCMYIYPGTGTHGVFLYFVFLKL